MHTVYGALQNKVTEAECLNLEPELLNSEIYSADVYRMK